MQLPRPIPPPYDIREWRTKPYAERLRLVCQCWALDGYGTPSSVYLFYLLKILLYIGAWSFFVGYTAGLGGPREIASWWYTPQAFQKAVLWSMAFEGLGLGCGSGPLTGRYLPPVVGFLHFLRPGTTRLPLSPRLPLTGGDRRTLVDVALYAAHYFFLLRALVSPAITPALLLPTAVLLPLMGLRDKTLFLVSRGEHYYTVLVCFLFSTEWLPASRLVWIGVWLWAATSKLTLHFPSVVSVMQSNSPLTRIGPLRRIFFHRFPDDLRPSPLVHWMAHTGTLLEFAFPLLLVLGGGGPVTTAALAVMLLFHLFITSSIPMGVPIEWNFLMVYGAFFLFGHHAEVSAAGIHSPLLIAWLLVNCAVVPLLGNFLPAHVSFLNSMRYYAGNWAYSVWLVRGDSSKKLDRFLVKSAARVQDQLARLYDEDVTTAAISKVMAFRAMHLHGRALPPLLARAVDDIDAYEYVDGEIVAGVVLGWNFGDGHLHNEQLLAAVQRQCGFEPGELRCVFVEAQPLFTPRLPYRIVDAATGLLASGEVAVRDLVDRQPWE